MKLLRLIIKLRCKLIVCVNRKQCWVCFGNETDDPLADWVSPCRCSGTTQWAHQECIQQWIDQQQRGSPLTKVNCPQCNVEYNIYYPKLNMLLLLLEYTDRSVTSFAPFALTSVVASSLYWCSFSYGFFTSCQILGQRETIQLIEKSDPVVVVIGFPLIPISLIVFNSIPMERFMLQCFAIQVPQMARRLLEPLGLYEYFRRIYPANGDENLSLPKEVGTLNLIARVVCGALMLPTIALFVGKTFFSYVEDSLKRTVLVCVWYLVLDTIKICMWVFANLSLN